ncbi:hypothetical protein [Burkholderia sp. SCN-KJ]|uniref:hypothetical protein n=1 Tax=Burkholderia sp. SCN-KJ TaxID=2969248 RepID=UPI002150444E|nr:hypothetical protein [Burkholderia sp. SCN-KJ]MCR4468313.1 hypothetical protein [Burkholderia sp. SCN-KJ]
MKATRTTGAAPIWQESPTDRQPADTRRPSAPSPRSRTGSPLEGLRNLPKKEGTGDAAAMRSTQDDLDKLMRAGIRVKPEAIRKANDDALKAAMAASLASSRSPANAMTGRQAHVLGALNAGLRVNPQAIQKANDDALAAAIQESLKQSSSTAPGTHGAHQTAHAQLNVPEGADWREILKMTGRVLPDTVMKHATTRAGVQKMAADIAKAELDARKAYRALLIRFHPDKHFGEDMKPVTDLLADAYNQSEKEFARARKWLEAQSKTITD